MSKLRLNVGKQITIPAVVMSVILAAAILLGCIIQFSANIDSEIHASLDTSSRGIEKNIEDFKSAAYTASLYISSDAAIAEAIESGDREALLQQASAMQAETGMEFCTITDGAGNVVLRTHEPDNYGDSVASQTNIQSAMAGKALSALEEGSAVRLSVRAGSPVYGSDGGIIGVVSVGYRLDTDVFVDACKEVYDVEVTIFQGDERIATTVVQDGKRAIGTTATAEVSEVVLAGQSYSGQAKVLEEDALVRYTPLFDVNGDAFGMLFVGRYLSVKNSVVMSFVLVSIGIALVVILIALVILMRVSKGIAKPLGVMSRFFQRAGSTGDLTLNAEELQEINRVKDRTDEIGALSENCVDFVGHVVKAGGALEQLAQNDLSVEFNSKSDKDILGRSVQNVVGTLRQAISNIVEATSQISAGATQIAESAQLTAEGSAEQAATIEELSSSMSEIAEAAKKNSITTVEVLEDNSVIARLAGESRGYMMETEAIMGNITNHSSSLNDITKLIDNIAFQTNILALNASVEAARAGAHGKGFAVVAEEVRVLAARSAEAAKHAAEIITLNSADVDHGNEALTTANDGIVKLIDVIAENTIKVEELQEASRKQSDEVAQINEGVDRISNVVQQNSATAQESAASAEQLSGQSSMLQDLTAQFKLGGNERPRIGAGSMTKLIGESRYGM